MSSHQRKFYMIRLKGGEWEPRRKITRLPKAMEVAYQMAQYHKKPATILQTVSRVEIVDGKPLWSEEIPKDLMGVKTPRAARGVRGE